MKAVIMAGGEGSRLRPLTCDMPKPMARLCGRPILEYILELLSRNGFDEAVLTLGYMPHVIREHFPEERYGTIKLQFCEEKTPLGTAGGVKNAAGDMTDDFLVISGDALCDFDLKSAVDFHKKSGAAVTIVVTRVKDPREYGLVNMDESGNVTGFTEKPAWTGVTTDLANTGIYIINPQVLALIPENRSFDFANHLFPRMLSEGMILKAYEAEGYWCDIGDLTSYRQCQQDMLSGQVHIPMPREAGNGIYGNLPEKGTYKIFPPVYLGQRVRIGQDAVIGPNTIIDDGCEIGANARIRSSVLLPRVMVDSCVRMTGSTVCSGSTIESDASLYEGSTLGSHSHIGQSAEILPGVSVWPGKHIEAGTKVSENVRVGEARREYFDDEGISGQAGVEITPEFCCRLGAAIGSLKNAQRIGIGYGDSIAAKAMHYAILSGLMETGVQVWDFGKLLESQIHFAASFCGLSACVWTGGVDSCTIKVFDHDGLPIPRKLEREIESCLVKGEAIRCHAEHYRDAADMNGFYLLYQQELYRCAPDGLGGIKAKFYCDNEEGERLFRDTFIRLGGQQEETVQLFVSADGRQVSAKDEKNRSISEETMLAIGCLTAFMKNQSVAVPFDAPKVIDACAEKYGQQCRRYFNLSDGTDEEIRQMAKGQFWLRDGMMLALHILNTMKQQNCQLADLADQIPAFATQVHYYTLHQSPSSVMEKLSTISENAPQGIQIKSGNTVIRIWPQKRGKALRITAEAANAEIAEELCGDIQSKITDLLDRKQ